jgi:hypothetical protein
MNRPSSDSRSRDGEIRLLPEQELLSTRTVDHAQWNYRPILGRIQRLRFDLFRSMLQGSRASRLLEIGYGSGVFSFPNSRNTPISFTALTHTATLTKSRKFWLNTEWRRSW